MENDGTVFCEMCHLERTKARDSECARCVVCAALVERGGNTCGHSCKMKLVWKNRRAAKRALIEAESTS